MPTPPFNATISPPNQQPTNGNSEIVRVLTMTGDAVTSMLRAQEGTVAQSILPGDTIQETITAKTITDIETAASAPGPALGVSGRHYSYLQAANSGYTTPNAAPLQITTAGEFRILCLPDNSNTGVIQNLLGKWNITSNQRAYQMGFDASGKLQFQFSADGTNTVRGMNTTQTYASLKLPPQVPIWLSFVPLSNNGSGQSQCTFRYRFDSDALWTTIGVVTNPNPGPFFNSTAGMNIGQTAGGANLYAGRIYIVEVYDATSTLVARFDARGLVNNTDDYTNPTSHEVWTHQTNTQVIQDRINDLDPITGSILPRVFAPGSVGDTVGTDSTGVMKNRRATEFNFKHQGALGDGTTDDSAVIIAACLDTRPKVIPAGIYAINADVLVPGLAGDSWRGVGCEWKPGASNNLLNGSIIKARAAGTNLASFSGAGQTIDGIGFDGNGLCTTDVFAANAGDLFIGTIVTINPSATGNAYRSTVNGDRAVVNRLWASGNNIGLCAVKLEGADGKYEVMHPSNAATLLSARSGGNQVGIVHGSTSPANLIGTHHLIVACTKFFLLHGEFDNPYNGAHVYIDPASAFSGGATIGTIVLGLHLNLGQNTADNTIPAIQFNTGTGFNIKNGKIRATILATTASRFTYAIDPGSDPTKLKGWDVDINFQNPSGANGTTIIGPNAWTPEKYKAVYSVDSLNNTWASVSS